ncbi:MAG: ABC transporter ATP-binding protein [Candidatus Berkelbacteria bacterium]|nr:MAG: ABC transporter ATP-binding protein [Candidatus Berkelbacteria bacterium]QQG51961.1 MAG: ABC transporter ATP-binding protein [Candidatus Berkelbacteria bacterium]
MIKATELSKTFNPRQHTEVKAVESVSISIEPGEIVLIIGPSGSGKTTLLTMLGGLLSPSAGEIFIADQPISKLSQGQLTMLRRGKIGFIFQSFNLLDNLTAFENVVIAGFGKNRNTKRALELLNRLGLQNRLHAKPKELSGGERQRVAVARSLINNPPIILADEPTANLDSKNGHSVMLLLCEIACQEHKSVVIVSHDQRLRDIATRVVTIEDGKLTNEAIGDHAKFCPHHNH